MVFGQTLNTLDFFSYMVLSKHARTLYLPFKWILKSTILKSVYGGETVRDCHPVFRKFQKEGIGVILDYCADSSNHSTEKSTLLSGQSAAGIRGELLNSIGHSKEWPSIKGIILKISRVAPPLFSSDSSMKIGSSELLAAILRCVLPVCKAAADADKKVFIDAEESRIQPVIDKLGLELMRQFNVHHPIIFITLQMSRNDITGFLNTVLEEFSRKKIFTAISLVRGGYDYQNSRHRFFANNNFKETVKCCLKNIHRISFVLASHDKNIIGYLKKSMKKAGIKPNHPFIYCAQVNGIRNEVSFELSAEGYNVLKYLPYGPSAQVIPHIMKMGIRNRNIWKYLVKR